MTWWQAAAVDVVIGSVALLVLFAVWHRVVGTGSLRRRKLRDRRTATVLAGDSGVGLIYKEIFEERSYFKHGVTLPKNDNERRTNGAPPLILDVGANIGFFAASCAEDMPRYEIHCVEPIPVLALAARRNTAALNIDADRSIRIHETGLAAEEQNGTSVSFDFNPGVSVGSTMFKSDISAAGWRHGPCTWVAALLHDYAWAGQLPKQPTGMACALLHVPIVKYAVLLLLVPLFYLLFLYQLASPSARREVCSQLTTLPALLRREGLNGRDIDMVKVDVEGAEWLVLQGIDDETWARIRQLIVEVHNVDGRVKEVTQLLRDRGFANVVVGTECMEILKLLDVATVFATKEKKGLLAD
jgi:hypothetical protein